MQSDPIAIIAKQFPQVVIPLVDNALHSIRVLAFDWRFYPTQPGNPVTLFNMAIARAARRGVEVRALVNNDAIVAALRKQGSAARRLHSTKMLHSKLLIFDETKIVIGSHNLTQHAFLMNEEASVLCTLPDANNEFVRYFDHLFGV
jgi:phosphatidylserine/phosphatidylglycerophosphate/cardiolipin synthase-like enzyme